VELIVAPEEAGQRLDRYLAGPAGSRAQAQRLIEEGCVLIDGQTARKNDRIAAGSTIRLLSRSLVEVDATLEQAPFEIRYEDDALLVVDKPAGVVVHPAGGHHAGTLSQALAAHGARGGEPLRPGIVHRLDKDTSGLLVVAKNEEAHRRLRAALAAREIVREYLALVDGRPPSRAGTIDAPIGRVRRARGRISIDSDAPRAARTHFELLEALPGSSLLRVRLETGRTHQIRAHFEAIGHPVRGDQQYGRVPLRGLHRQFLHAARLAFAQPFTGAPIDVRSPLPSELELALAAARDE
jgi:23S rRNA pseudouridine1911/1915/1917 synthase